MYIINGHYKMNNDFIKVYSGTFIGIQLAIERLEQQGIVAVLKDELGLGLNSGFTMPYSGYQELFVQKNDLDLAVRIIETIKHDLEA